MLPLRRLASPGHLEVMINLGVLAEEAGGSIAHGTGTSAPQTPACPKRCTIWRPRQTGGRHRCLTGLVPGRRRRRPPRSNAQPRRPRPRGLATKTRHGTGGSAPQTRLRPRHEQPRRPRPSSRRDRQRTGLVGSAPGRPAHGGIVGWALLHLERWSSGWLVVVVSG